jgi:hypothetical protein
MATIVPFLKDDAAFDPKDIQSMSMAFEDVCKALGITPDATNDREIIASRVIELARRGERSPAILRDRVLREAEAATGQNGHGRFSDL